MSGQLRSAVRNTLARPTLSAAIVLPIALAIALNSALFSVIDGLLFRPLPFENPSELIAIDYSMPGGVPPEVAYLPALLERRLAIRDGIEAHVQTAAQAGYAGRFFAAEEEKAYGIEATGVDARFFRVFGLQPTLGGAFSEADEHLATGYSEQSDVPLPVIIGHELWQRLYGGDPNVLGVRRLAGRRVRIAGVMGPGVKFPGETNLWAPVRRDRQRPPAYARLRPGVTVEQLASRFSELEIEPLRDAIRPGGSRGLVLLFAATGLLLLVAWIQVAGLVFSRALARIEEIGVRLALGASRARLVREFAIENALLAGVAFVIASGAAPALTAFVIAWLPREISRGQYLTPDARTFAFACVVSLVGLGLLTTLPLELVRRASPHSLLSGRIGRTSFRHDRVRQVMLAAQMTFTCALLYVAGLAAHSLVRVTTFDYGFDAERVLIFTPPGEPAPESRAEERRWVAERERRAAAAIDRLRGLPMVAAAERFTRLPLQRRPSHELQIVQFGGRLLIPAIRARQTSVGPDFARALGAELVEGTSFDRPDLAGARDVAVVNETLARQLAPAVPVLGMPVREAVLDREIRTTSRTTYRIVGVLRDLVQTSPAAPPDPQLFTPITVSGIIAIRTAVPPERALPAVRAVLEQVWGDVPPQRFSDLRDELAGVLLPYRGRSILLSLIAAFCVPLAAVGLSGALLYFVRGRTRDTAIRLALGAEPAAVRRDVIRRALTPVAIGIVAGTALGISAGRIAASQLFQVHPADPLTMAAVALGLLGLSWLVALVPAAHASSLDPAKALRES